MNNDIAEYCETKSFYNMVSFYYNELLRLKDDKTALDDDCKTRLAKWGILQRHPQVNRLILSPRATQAIKILERLGQLP